MKKCVYYDNINSTVKYRKKEKCNICSACMEYFLEEETQREYEFNESIEDMLDYDGY